MASLSACVLKDFFRHLVVFFIAGQVVVEFIPTWADGFYRLRLNLLCLFQLGCFWLTECLLVIDNWRNLLCRKLRLDFGGLFIFRTVIVIRGTLGIFKLACSLTFGGVLEILGVKLLIDFFDLSLVRSRQLNVLMRVFGFVQKRLFGLTR